MNRFQAGRLKLVNDFKAYSSGKTTRKICVPILDSAERRKLVCGVSNLIADAIRHRKPQEKTATAGWETRTNYLDVVSRLLDTYRSLKDELAFE